MKTRYGVCVALAIAVCINLSAYWVSVYAINDLGFVELNPIVSGVMDAGIAIYYLMSCYAISAACTGFLYKMEGRYGYIVPGILIPLWGFDLIRDVILVI